MYRVTTPTHTFTLPIETSTCKEIQVTYYQEPKKNVSKCVPVRTVGGEYIVKHYQNGQLPEGMTLDGKNVIIRLTQEETKLFNAGDVIKAQVRVLTNADDAFASQKFNVQVYDVLNEEILKDD